MNEIAIGEAQGTLALGSQSSPIIVVGSMAFAFGLLPVDLDNSDVSLPEAVEDQLLKILKNMEILLKKHGLTRRDVIACTIHITQFQRFSERVVNAYEGFFPLERMPTRSMVGVQQLPRHALVGMDVIAAR